MFSDFSFISANTASGFKRFFDGAFTDCEYRYIIKGGPGTGKSSFMRRVGRAAEEKGHRVEYFLCSSDPDSLDGIIISDMKIGITDGTSPHPSDVDIAGVNSEILNFGSLWNGAKIKKSADKITALTERKSHLYDEVYRALRAVYISEKISHSFALEAFNTEKAAGFVHRLARSYPAGSGKKRKIRLHDAYGMSGHTILSLPHGKVNYRILPMHGAEYILACMMAEEFERRGHALTVYPRALDGEKISAFTVPELDLTVYVGDGADDAKKINTERFVAKETLARNKNKIKFSERCAAEFEKEVLDAFAEIRETHFALEKIYSSAMSFRKLNLFTDKFINNLLG